MRIPDFGIPGGSIVRMAEIKTGCLLQMESYTIVEIRNS